MRSKPKPDRTGFTLIELLIVVAIIAILAAIAVPNFLEAQTRSKVSRVKADLRTVATALEAYAVDNNSFPVNDGVYNVLPIQITTPVAFLSSSRLVDPFTDKERIIRSGVPPEMARFFTYTKTVTLPEVVQLAQVRAPMPPSEAIDATGFNPGAFLRYGKWRLVSNGPDRIYAQQGTPTDPVYNPNPATLWGCDIPYDATNGTVSFGNVLRTQLVPDGIALRPN